MKQMGYGKASGKIILAGEHAVVYGHEALALPFFAANVQTRITKSNLNTHTIESACYSGELDNVPQELFALRDLVYSMLNNTKSTPLHIEINSSIPMGSGLGSSASVSISLVRALSDYLEISLDNTQVLNLVGVSESFFHSNPSGIDMHTILKEKPIWFSNRSEILDLGFMVNGYVVVGDSGTKGNTKEAVEEVSKLKVSNPQNVHEIMEAINKETKDMYEAWKKSNLEDIGSSMTKIHGFLASLNLSTPVLDNLVQSSLKSGALGSKLTGSGKGGCVIALCEDLDRAQSVARSMKETGAIQTWIYSLKEIDL